MRRRIGIAAVSCAAILGIAAMETAALLTHTDGRFLCFAIAAVAGLGGWSAHAALPKLRQLLSAFVTAIPKD